MVNNITKAIELITNLLFDNHIILELVFDWN